MSTETETKRSLADCVKALWPDLEHLGAMSRKGDHLDALLKHLLDEAELHEANRGWAKVDTRPYPLPACIEELWWELMGLQVHVDAEETKQVFLGHLERLVSNPMPKVDESDGMPLGVCIERLWTELVDFDVDPNQEVAKRALLRHLETIVETPAPVDG
jgi:hypothetical protein